MSRTFEEVARLVARAWRDDSKWERCLSEAVRLLRRHLREDPRCIRALTCLGAVLSDMGRHREAVAVLQRACSLGSTDANTYFNLGVATMNTAERGAAIRHFQRARGLEADPATFEAYFDPHAH